MTMASLNENESKSLILHGTDTNRLLIKAKANKKKTQALLSKQQLVSPKTMATIKENKSLRST